MLLQYKSTMTAGKLPEDTPTRLLHLRQRAQDEKKANRKYFNKLANRKPKGLDAIVSGLHEEVFQEEDCLQ